MIFASDNWAGAHPKIAASLAAQAQDYAPAYGTSDLDQAVSDRFSILFEREAAVFFVATGTAANALSLALVNRPGGIAFAHREAHMLVDECGAPEYLTGGGRLAVADAALRPHRPAAGLRTRAPGADPDFVHGALCPMAVLDHAATEVGIVYGESIRDPGDRSVASHTLAATAWTGEFV